jgi:hypothetical protein
MRDIPFGHQSKITILILIVEDFFACIPVTSCNVMHIYSRVKRYSFSWNAKDVGPHRDLVGEYTNTQEHLNNEMTLLTLPAC